MGEDMALNTETKNNFLEMTRIRKSFAGLTALQDVSLSVSKGEVVCIIGPSGCGKSTLLRTANWLTPADAGEVRLNGEIVGAMPDPRSKSMQARSLNALRARIGMVFQQFNLFPHLTAIENVQQPQILIKKKNKAEAQDKASELFNMIGLNDKVDHYPHQLSGGQQQRVAIARALAMDPKIMLFDEVTSALDPELVDEVLQVLHKLASNSDTTMLTVTHEMNFARDFADRVLFFDNGQIVESGKPADIFSNPKEDRTRSFLKKFISNIN